MRDAFGGTFLFEVLLVFMLVYIVLIAVSVNYAKAFKVKDVIIDYIESNEADVSNMSKIELEELENFFDREIIGEMNYVKNDINDCKNIDKYKNVYCKNGIRIDEISVSDKHKNTEGIYYRVTTYFGWDLTRLNIITALSGDEKDNSSFTGYWRISGETKLIVKG